MPAHPPLTVTIDARVIYDEVRRGIAKTVIGTYRALSIARPTWRFIMLFQKGVNDNPFVDLTNVTCQKIDIPGDRFHLWDLVRLPWANVANRADVFHAPAGPAPRIPAAPLVVTINDLIPLDTRPNDADVRQWGHSVQRAARKARVILTASEHAKSRIVHHFGVPESKIELVHWGPLSPPHGPIEEHVIAELGAKYGIPRHRAYVLHFGMADPRKNTARTIDAWARLPASVRARYSLLIVGVQGPSLEHFREQSLRSGIAESTHIHGYSPEADLPVLLAGATVLCYPTEYEGFGLPVLDGFAAKVPVLAGNRTSVPEVAGDAAELVDPTSTGKIAAGLERLLTDEHRREELVVKGSRRLAEFCWERTAEEVAVALERAATLRTRGGE